MKTTLKLTLACVLSAGVYGSVQADDATVVLTKALMSKMETAPAVYRLQAATAGLSLEERKRSLYTLKLNGQAIMANASSMLRRLTVSAPGTHLLEVEVRTPTGRILSDSVNLTVEPNKAPVCNIKVTLPDMSGPRPNKLAGVSLNPDCRDPDGRIVRTNWYLNGSQTPMRQSSTLVIPAWTADRKAPNCFDVRFVAFDDQGNKAEGAYSFPACSANGR